MKEWIVTVGDRVSFLYKRKKYKGTVIQVEDTECVLELDKAITKGVFKMKLPKGALRKLENKYRVSPKSERTYNGKVYASTLEMDYRIFLDSRMSKATPESDRVIDIVEQPVYHCDVNGIRVTSYKPDFEVYYFDRVEVVDTKGKLTDASTIRIKLCEALYELKVKIIYRKDFKL